MSPYIKKPAPQHDRHIPGPLTQAKYQVTLSENAVRGAVRSLERIDPARSPGRHARQVDRLNAARTSLAEARLKLATLLDDQDPNRQAAP